MDSQTLESLAEMICGDNGPVYRTGSDLTRFFHRIGFSNFNHDGSTRKWWTLSVLTQLTENNLRAVIYRLADPKEYSGDSKLIRSAIEELNNIFMLEGIKIEIDGIKPVLKSVIPQFVDIEDKEKDLKPLPPPEFLALKIEPGLGKILSERWNETQICFDKGAYLAATILMGTMLEGILLAVLQKFPKDANVSKSAPKEPKTGKVKYFAGWSLSDMINVAHDVGWIDLDVKKFSHSLREFRNIIHPYQQMALKTYPDENTCKISWLVVQATTNDLARKLI